MMTGVRFVEGEIDDERCPNQDGFPSGVHVGRETYAENVSIVPAKDFIWTPPPSPRETRVQTAHLTSSYAAPKSVHDVYPEPAPGAAILHSRKVCIFIGVVQNLPGAVIDHIAVTRFYARKNFGHFDVLPDDHFIGAYQRCQKRINVHDHEAAAHHHSGPGLLHDRLTAVRSAHNTVRRDTHGRHLATVRHSHGRHLTHRWHHRLQQPLVKNGAQTIFFIIISRGLSTKSMASTRVTECAHGRPSICKVKVTKNEATLLEITKNENYIKFKRGCPPAECDNDQVRFVLHPAQSCPVCLGPNYYTQQMCVTITDCAPLATTCINGVCRFDMPSNLEVPFSYKSYCEHRSDCPTFYHCFQNECVDDKYSVYHIENLFCSPPRWVCPTNFDCHPEKKACFAQKLCSSDGECDEDQR
uniref:Uncharacterized protein n=1 Tax=Romanomermis culicivorax TaxID=13658 RepID=A0A915L4B4_ROMCU